MIRIHTNKHNTVPNLYIPPRDAAPHHVTLETDIRNFIQHITGRHGPILIGDLNIQSTHWYPNTDDHSGTLISNIINNSNTKHRHNY